jgi:hypothetical protein
MSDNPAAPATQSLVAEIVSAYVGTVRNFVRSGAVQLTTPWLV